MVDITHPANFDRLSPVLVDALRVANPGKDVRAVLADARVVRFVYTNHHGNTVRDVVPTGRLVVDDNYHPGVPYLVEAYDNTRGAVRTFDPEFITGWRILGRDLHDEVLVA